MIGFFIALLSGALMSIQGVFNTQVTKTSGIWVANAFVQFTALLVCLGVWHLLALYFGWNRSICCLEGRSGR